MTKEYLSISHLKPIHDELSLAIGFFDGLHLGHQELIKEVLSHKEYIPSVLTFSLDLKAKIHQQKEELILTKEERDDMFASLGIQKEFILPFDEKTMHTSKEDFLLFLSKLKAKYIIVGSDFTFGDKASGKAQDLLFLQEQGIHVIIKDLLNQREEKISSSRIKKLLKEHQIEQANEDLGYPFFLQGEVIHGLKNGARIGYPTANIQYPEDKVILPNGVYKTKVEIDGNIYLGMTNIGNHPTISALEENIIETNILHYQGNLYGKRIKVSFLKYIREQKKFASLDELVKQLKKDYQDIEETDQNH